MVKEGYKGVFIQLPESLANKAPKLLKGKMSAICQKAIELALGVNGEIARTRAELLETQRKSAFLESYLNELLEKKKNRPVRYKTIC